MSAPTPDPKLAERLKRWRVDPAALPIAVAGLVLVGAVIWLLSRPMPPPTVAQDPQLTTELAALRADAQRRLAALEARAVVDLAPLREQIAAAERRAAALEARAVPDLAPLVARVTAAERATAELAARPAAAPPPTAALDALGQRLSAAEAALAQRAAAAEAQAARLAAAEAALAQRAAAIEAQAARVTALEGTAQRLTALEARASRLAAIDGLRAALAAGQPLGAGLAALPNAPAALARFATAGAPTEAALKLSFEDAARAALAASDPGHDQPGIVDAAVSRVTGLLTVRRGEQMLWGDAAAAEIERARRAVEAGDLEGALARLSRLSPAAREAMRGWIGQAEAVVAARAALRSLAAG
jgi:hypothetical protein